MKTRTITIRVSEETADYYERLRVAGAYKCYTNSAFARIIFNIGLAKYEKVILPIENDGYPVMFGAKIIQFPERKGGA